MGGVAALARELGDRVTGADANVYPPMSTQLESLGIALREGWDPAGLPASADRFLIGNALSRGNPSVEALLNSGRPYGSGAQWLGERVLPGRRVLAVAGTHGKTTTSAIAAWLLEASDLAPGFLIGGVPSNFGVSARLGKGPFVVEADEYDTAFFDKRSKFVHYRPEIAILNNLEFDHADIFSDLDAIKTQFHHLVRTVPGCGRLIVNAEDANLSDVLTRGAWTPIERFAIAGSAQAEWLATARSVDGSHFTISHCGHDVAEVRWSLIGRHNMLNAVAAVAAVAALGVEPAHAAPALADFHNVARRMQCLVSAHGIHVYDDFAHHPTAIRETLAGLRARAPTDRIVVVFEPRSNSMRQGAHAAALPASFDDADQLLVLQPAGTDWDPASLLAETKPAAQAFVDPDPLYHALRESVRAGDQVVFMSNGGFCGLPARFAAYVRGAVKP